MFGEAERHYLEALRQKPDFLDARFNLGNTFARQGRFQEAAREYREVLRRKPTYREARENLEKALALSRLGKVPSGPP
jgi:tetratricopeptide (TPR) repeat protein